MTAQIWQFILEGVIILLGCYIAFLKSYFTEKGKSLATIQDISEITRLVESVKVEFARDTENLKSHLQFLVNVQNSLVNEERIAIIDYNLKLFAWLNLLTDAGFGGINNEDNTEIEKAKLNYQTKYSDVLNSETKFSLFIDNAELIRELHDLKIGILQSLHTLPLLQLQELSYKNIKINELMLLPESLDKHQQLQSLLRERHAFQMEYIPTISIAYSKVAQNCAIFQKNCRNYLYKLFESDHLKSSTTEAELDLTATSRATK